MIKKVFPILALSIFSSMLGMGIIVPLLPLYAENLGASGVGLGIIFAGFPLSQIIFMPIIGRLSDRRGRKLFICTGLLIYSLLSLGYIWADSVLKLTLVRLVQGAAGGMIVPMAQAYIGDLSPKGEEGTWMGYCNAAFFTGAGIGPLMGGTLTDHFGMNIAFLTMGSLNLLASVIAILFLPEVSGGKRAATYRLSFREMGSSGIVKGAFSFRVVDALGRGALFTFLPILSTLYIGLSPTRVGVLLTVYMLLMSLLQLVSGNLADRFNRRAMVALGSFTNLASMSLIPLTHSFFPLLGLCALSGVGRAISLPAASALVVDEGRKFGMGSTLGVYSMAMSIGLATGPLLGGVIADNVNINGVFYFAASAALLGTSLFIWFTR